MGRYLSVAVAKNIWVYKRSNETTEKTLEKLRGKINLDIYEVVLDEKDYMGISLKKDILSENIIDLIERQIRFCHKYDKEDLEEKTKKLKEIKEKRNKKMIEIEDICEAGFNYLEGSRVSNDISYIAEDLDIFCDAIELISEGKVIFECYNGIFEYIRNNIIANLDNKLKTSIMVTIIG